ncbi:MAG: hypothetical protein AB7T06_39760 [Kofleriaceae bacterium]
MRIEFPDVRVVQTPSGLRRYTVERVVTVTLPSGERRSYKLPRVVVRP